MHIRDVKDLILGVLSAAFGAYLTFSDGIISGFSLMSDISFFARAEIYIKFLGILLMILGVIIFIRSIGFGKAKIRENTERIAVKKETVITAAALAVYIVLFSVMGYFIPTLLLVGLLTGVYRYREESDLPVQERTPRVRAAAEILIYSVVVVAGLYIIFTEFLGVAFY